MALLAAADSKSFSIPKSRFFPIGYSDGREVAIATAVTRDKVRDDGESFNLRRRMALLQIEVLSCSGGDPNSIKELVSGIPEDLLEEKDENGNTALHHAAAVGNKFAVETLINSHGSLLMGRNSDDDSPLHLAAAFGRRDTVCFLLSEIIGRRPKGTTASLGDSESGRVTEDPNRLFDGESGIKLIHLLISSDLLDVALEVLKRYPSLVWAKSNKWKTPMETLAHKRDAFRSGTLLRISHQVLYHCIQIPKVWQYMERAYDKESSNWYSSSRPKNYAQSRAIYNLKLVNTHAIELLRFLINQALELGSSSETLKILESSTRVAVRLGIVEFVGEVLASWRPTAIMDLDERGYSLFHQAILHRQSKVFKLLSDQKISFPPCGRSCKDDKGNNFLHLAAEIKLYDHFIEYNALAHIESEFEWFKRAKMLVGKSYRDEKNNAGKTPGEVITEQHEPLVLKIRQSTKEASSNCATIAALTATVAFAGCFTFPGGIDEKGSPNLLANPRFRGFVYTNAVAVVASLISLVMFLKVLMFPCQLVEESFATKLSMTLIQGILWLFVAIGGVLLTFAASLSLMISRFEGDDGSGLTWLGISPYVWCVIPVYIGVIVTNVEVYSVGRYKVEKKKIGHESARK